MSMQHDGIPALVAPDADETPVVEPQRLVDRLLAAYRESGVLPIVRGGDHDADTDASADESREDESNPDESTSDESTDESADERDDDEEESDSEDIERLRDDLKKARNEAKNLRRRLRAAERERDEARAGQSDVAAQLQGDLETARSRIGELEDELRDIKSRDVVRQEAEKAGAISPNAVYALIRDDLEYDDQGNPTNVSEVIDQLREREGRLFAHAAGHADGGPTGDVIDAVDPISRMTAAYAANTKRR